MPMFWELYWAFGLARRCLCTWEIGLSQKAEGTGLLVWAGSPCWPTLGRSPAMKKQKRRSEMQGSFLQRLQLQLRAKTRPNNPVQRIVKKLRFLPSADLPR